MKYTPRKYFAHNLATGAVTTAKVGKKIVTTDSGDPAASDDTGEGYIVGSMWLNTTSGEQFVAGGVGAENAVWYGQKGENINLFLHQASTTVGKCGGHRDGSAAPGGHGYQSTTIESMPVATDGNSTDIGETSPSLGMKGWQVGCAKDGYPASYIYWYGLQGTSPGDAHTSEMVRHAVTSPATLVDIGEETNAHASGGIGQSKTHWFVWSGGGYGPSTSGVHNSGPYTTQIEKSTFAAPTTSSDSGGDLSAATGDSLGYTNLDNAKCWMVGGQGPFPVTWAGTEKIESFPTAISSGNQTDEGELSRVVAYGGACASTTHFYVSAYRGSSPEETNILKGSFTAPVADTDIGELTRSVYEGYSASGDVSGYRFGGKIGSPYTTLDSVDKWSFTSDGNATDVGEMTEDASMCGSWQD